MRIFLYVPSFFVDDLDMKCKFLFRAALVSVTGVLFLLFAGCGSTPRGSTPPVEQTPPKDDVWSLLEQGESDKARLFFLGEVDVNAVDSQGRTPLHIAAEIKDPGLAAFFISLGANVEALDNENRTPLGISAEKRDPGVAKALAGAGANIHAPLNSGSSPALTAVSLNGDFLSALLTPASVESADKTGKTILHLAAMAGNVQGIDRIIAAGGPPGKQDHEGENPLDLALSRPDSRNHMEAAERLILAGAYSENPIFPYFAPAARSSNYNVRSGDGLAPLHFAARAGHEGLIKFLI
jgi:ankyrin repeat protein